MWYRDPLLTRAAAVSAGVLFFLPGCQPSAVVVGSTARIAARAAEEASGGGFGSRKAEADTSRAEKPDKDDLRDVKQVLQDAYAGGETPNPAKWTPLKQLTPVPSGEGVVVFEPVSRGADAATADVAAGCANWLQLALGAQLDLGKTPLLTTIGRVRTQLGKKDLRLEPAEAAKLAALTGATRAVAGEVSGSGTQCTLTLQTYSVPDGKPVGQPIRLEGPTANLPGKLPDAAKRLAVALGVKSPQASPAPQLKAEDLALLGRLMYRSPNAQEAAQLEALGPHDSLAALLLVDSGQAKSQAAALKSLMTQAGKNPLVLGHIGYIAATALAPYRETISTEFKQHPRNYALAHTNVWLNRVLHRPNSERLAAEAVVRDAPRNPDAWLSLGWTASTVAHTVRKGRVYDAMDAGEQALIGHMYEEWLAAVYRAAQLDPEYGRAWDRVAQAATFAGEGKLAKEAFWRAAKYSPEKASLYEWGLQMFQPKWGGDPDDLRRVAELAVKEKYPTYRETLNMANELRSAEFKEQGNALSQRVIDDCAVTLKRDPENQEAHWYRGVALWEKGEVETASLELEALAKAHADDAKLQQDVGDLMDQRQRHDRAIKYFRRLIELKPDSAYGHFSLGWDLKQTGKLDEAEKQFREALRIDPDHAGAYRGLAQVAAEQHHNADAIRNYKTAIRLNEYDADSEFRLSILLSQQKQFDEALLHCKRVTGMRQDYEPAWFQLGYVYMELNKPAAAAQACGVAAQLKPEDMANRDNFGQALYLSGHKEEGLKELRQALQSGDESVKKDAQEFLAKHPQ